MTCEVVIAVRGGPGAKFRCRERLNAREREALVEAMLCDMLQALAACAAVRRVYVATPTPGLARIAAGRGAVVILEAAASNLNRTFASARRRIVATNPTATLALLPGDLPLLDAAELTACLQAAEDGAVVIAPATADGGTGALIHRADVPLPLAFGPDSFRNHCAAAAALGLDVRRVDAPSLGFDVDRPEDLDALAAAPSAGRAAGLMRTLLAEEAAA
ncbi:MAG TPA: 2-phospho-L-lactate guanylyltransferase [Caulobacteraceae bacterium]|jgi:2-phospho-L-lactate guanylyltransferase|nr:2-phospho-L-lactate guanylyltransferase [Caulobacteraceae bacterium]